MTVGFIIQVIFELGGVFIVLYGVLHEDELIDFEDEMSERFDRWLDRVFSHD